MEEIWKAVVGFEGEYEVSNLGRVRSLTRVHTYQRVDQYSGNVIEVSRTHKGKELWPGLSKSGHLSVVLGRGNTKHIHVLVLEAFVGPRPAGMEGLHGDDEPSNNRLYNLRWGTRSENLHDAIANGKSPIGSRKWNAKLNEEQVANIKANLLHLPNSEIAAMHGVSPASIRQIREERAWTHVR